MPDEPVTGATPGAGATPATTTATTPPADPAKGDTELGDAGKRAIQEERTQRAAEKKRADDAEAELQKLRDATSSETDKAINTARREAEAAERAKWQERFRAAEVRGALRGAGIVNDRMLALAVGAPEFANLAVGDDGSVAGVSDAVEAFKVAMPEAFKPAADPRPGAGGTVRTGVQPPPEQAQVQPGYERLSAAYAAADAAKTK